MSGKQFQLFQVAQQADGMVEKVLWLADITAEPKLHLRTARDKPKTVQDTIAPVPDKKTRKKTIAGQSDGQVKAFWVKSQLMDENFDDYGNVDAREALDSRYIISWDADALGKTDEVIQYDFSNQDNHEPFAIEVIPGENSVVVDIRNGKDFQLFSEGVSFMIINPLKPGDLNLVNLAKVKYDGQDYLEIIPQTNNKIVGGLSREGQGGGWGEVDLSWLRPMRYANFNNYVKSGFIRVRVSDILKNGKSVSKEHEAVWRYYTGVGAIGINPKTGKPQTEFVTQPWILKGLAPDLYEKYGKTIRFPKLPKAVKKPLSQPPTQSLPPGQQAPAKESEDKESTV
jgi:hypothetical protein